MGVQIRDFVPAAALRPYVLQYWEGTFNGMPSAVLEQKVLPSGYIELVLHLSEARCELKVQSGWETSAAFSLVGFWTTPFLLQFRDKVQTFAIRFKPEAVYFIFGIPAAEFINCSANLEDTFGSCFTSFCYQIEALKTVEERIQLTDTYLLNRLKKAQNRESYVQRAAELIRHQGGETTVESLSQEVCISTRQLEREFKNKLGLSPKSYMRIARLNKVMELLNQKSFKSLAQLSYYCGYADQAHFIREFKQLTGELPSLYASDQEGFMNKQEGFRE